ncbi:unnamed protein product [Penicillium egyptiacum]|uniref:Uncharacterized protein n=1 Tax=Penicillium egyptiacum TaxID=1303716 RepID=A0A9W4P3Q9_9EURO|nr:unnamed protein product [Penicillium egyptiacum]
MHSIVSIISGAQISSDDDIPPDVWNYAKKIFNAAIDDADLDLVSEKLWEKAKELVKKPSGEAEWTEVLHIAIDELQFPGLEVVRNRGRGEDLKPPVHNPPPTVPRRRGQSNRPVPETNLVDGSSVSSLPRATDLSSPLPTVPIFKLKAPRPDICTGLSDKSLVVDLEPRKGHSAARSFLFDLQDTGSLISDPHVTPMGLVSIFDCGGKGWGNWWESIPGTKPSCGGRSSSSSNTLKSCGTKGCPNLGGRSKGC